MDALPLMLDMGGAYAIRANGDLVQFDWDGPGGAEPLEDPGSSTSRCIRAASDIHILAVSFRHARSAHAIARIATGQADFRHRDLKT